MKIYAPTKLFLGKTQYDDQLRGIVRIKITFCINFEDALGVRVFSAFVKFIAYSPNFALEIHVSREMHANDFSIK